MASAKDIGGRAQVDAQFIDPAWLHQDRVCKGFAITGAQNPIGEQFGAPIASFQSIRFSLSTVRTELDAARLLVLRAAWLKDRGAGFTREAAQAKLYASEAANRAVSACLQVFGGYGYMRDYGIERYFRDARATTIYEGTSEVQRMVIARSLLAA